MVLGKKPKFKKIDEDYKLIVQEVQQISTGTCKICNTSQSNWLERVMKVKISKQPGGHMYREQKLK